MLHLAHFTLSELSSVGAVFCAGMVAGIALTLGFVARRVRRQRA